MSTGSGGNIGTSSTTPSISDAVWASSASTRVRQSPVSTTTGSHSEMIVVAPSQSVAAATLAPALRNDTEASTGRRFSGLGRKPGLLTSWEPTISWSRNDSIQRQSPDSAEVIASNACR